jgi:phospholipid/cholesterol/gamma-HCH transport system substrate-binding protein
MRGRRRSYVSTGLVALGALVVLVYLGFTRAIPFMPHWEIKAAFASANDLRPGSPVRIAGVEVGKVVGVQHVAGGGEGVIVTMRIAKEGRPVHTDATAKIRPRIFLEGNFFVDLTAGSPSAPALDDGDTIPVNQTATPVQLDQVLTSLQSDTREDLRTLLKEYGTALDGPGARGFNRSVEWWKPAWRDTALVNEAMLGTEEHDLSAYVSNAGATAAALDRHGERLKDLVTDFRVTAGAFAREQDSLRSALSELPRTLRAAQPALLALNDSFPPLRELARELLPGVRNSVPAIDASLPFVAQLRGLVSKPELRGLSADLRPAVADLAKLSVDGVPLYTEVRRNAACQNDVVLPWTKDTVPDENFPARSPVYREAPKPLPGLAGESRSGDANGQWFRILASGGMNLVTLKPGVFATTAFPVLGTNPPRPSARPPLNAEVRCQSQEPPDLRSKTGPPPPQKTIDPSDPDFLARWNAVRDRGVAWMKQQISDSGLDDQLHVTDDETTQAVIDQIDALTKQRNDELRRRLGGAGG